MKSKINLMAIIAIVALGYAASSTVLSSDTDSMHSPLAMANVEALSRYEIKGYESVVKLPIERGGPGCVCYGDGSKICCL